VVRVPPIAGWISQSILVAAMFRPLIVFADRFAVPRFAVKCAATVATAQGLIEVFGDFSHAKSFTVACLLH